MFLKIYYGEIIIFVDRREDFKEKLKYLHRKGKELLFNLS